MRFLIQSIRDNSSFSIKSLNNSSHWVLGLSLLGFANGALAMDNTCEGASLRYPASQRYPASHGASAASAASAAASDDPLDAWQRALEQSQDFEQEIEQTKEEEQRIREHLQEILERRTQLEALRSTRDILKRDADRYCADLPAQIADEVACTMMTFHPTAFGLFDQLFERFGARGDISQVVDLLGPEDAGLSPKAALKVLLSEVLRDSSQKPEIIPLVRDNLNILAPLEDKIGVNIRRLLNCAYKTEFQTLQWLLREKPTIFTVPQHALTADSGEFLEDYMKNLHLVCRLSYAKLRAWIDYSNDVPQPDLLQLGELGALVPQQAPYLLRSPLLLWDDNWLGRPQPFFELFEDYFRQKVGTDFTPEKLKEYSDAYQSFAGIPTLDLTVDFEENRYGYHTFGQLLTSLFPDVRIERQDNGQIAGWPQEVSQLNPAQTRMLQFYIANNPNLLQFGKREFKKDPSKFPGDYILGHFLKYGGQSEARTFLKEEEYYTTMYNTPRRRELLRRIFGPIFATLTQEAVEEAHANAVAGSEREAQRLQALGELQDQGYSSFAYLVDNLTRFLNTFDAQSGPVIDNPDDFLWNHMIDNGSSGAFHMTVIPGGNGHIADVVGGLREAGRMPPDWTPVGYLAKNAKRLKSLVVKTRGNGHEAVILELAKHYSDWGRGAGLQY